MHGASTRMRLNAPGRVAPKERPSSSCTITSPGTARRALRTRRARVGTTSFASRVTSCSRAIEASKAVFPPGPAHRSSQRSPSRIGAAAATARATSCEPSSCTRTVPPDAAMTRCGSPPGEPYAVGAYGRRGSPGSARPGSATRVTSGEALSASRRSSSSCARPSAARARRRARITQTGCAERSARRSSSERAESSMRCSHSPGVSREIRRSTAFAKLDAPRPFAAATRFTDSFTAACDATRVASS